LSEFGWGKTKIIESVQLHAGRFFLIRAGEESAFYPRIAAANFSMTIAEQLTTAAPISDAVIQTSQSPFRMLKQNRLIVWHNPDSYGNHQRNCTGYSNPNP
jgi:hypothetical protein